ncbi:MAG: rhodanese-like domain-containing protein [Methylotenera sp.]|nr:rhodanese-like domain-containing protein [Methylotenera sp.]
MLNQLKVSLSVLAILLLAGCNAQTASVTPKEAATMFAEKKAIILDVREDDEWKVQHIAGAMHIPLAQVETRLDELVQYKDQPVILQCRSGKRSAKAAGILADAGFTQVYNLAGGILAWDQDGLKTVKLN